MNPAVKRAVLSPRRWHPKDLGAYAVWLMNQAQTQASGRIVVPNLLSTAPVSTNLFSGSRRQFNNTVLWVKTNATAADNYAADQNGAVEASNIVGTGNWRMVTTASRNIPAGTYTLAAWVKRNAGTDQPFAFSSDSGTNRTVKTATASWTRETYTFTIGSPGTIQNLWLCSSDGSTNADILVCDYELYSGSSDLGATTYGGHLVLGDCAYDTRPTYASGELNLSSSGWGVVQLGGSKSLSTFTATAIVSQVAAGSGYNGILSKCQNYATFSVTGPHDSLPYIGFGADKFVDGVRRGLWSFLNKGYHAITARYDGTTFNLFVDDVKLYSLTGTVAAQTIQDLYVGLINLISLTSGLKINSIVLWDRALTDAEQLTHFTSLKKYALRDNITVTPATRVLAADGDSITASTSPISYAVQYGANANPSVFGTVRAVSGSKISDLVSRASAIDAILPANKSGRKFILTVFIGHNDLLDFATAQDWADALWVYTDARRAAGWTVGVATLLPSTLADFNTRRALANPIISAAVSTHYDFLIDFAADATMGPDAAASDVSLYSDGTHPTTLGQTTLEPVYRAAVNAV